VVVKTLLQADAVHDTKMAQQTQPEKIVQSERVLQVFGTLPVTYAENSAQLIYAVAGCVSFTEEPDVGRSSRQGCNPAGESPAVSVARVGHVVMPRPGMGNHPGYAWCKRPGRPVDYCGGCDLEA